MKEDTLIVYNAIGKFRVFENCPSTVSTGKKPVPFLPFKNCLSSHPSLNISRCDCLVHNELQQSDWSLHNSLPHQCALLRTRLPAPVSIILCEM